RGPGADRGDRGRDPRGSGGSSDRVGAELVRPAALTQLGHDLTLYLPDTLAGETEALADLVERARLTVVESEAQGDDLLLAFLERRQDRADVGVHDVGDHGVLGARGLGVLDEVAERRLLVGTHRHVEAHGVARVVEELLDLVRGDPRLPGQLLERRLAPELLVQLPLD